MERTVQDRLSIALSKQKQKLIMQNSSGAFYGTNMPCIVPGVVAPCGWPVQCEQLQVELLT